MKMTKRAGTHRVFWERIGVLLVFWHSAPRTMDVTWFPAVEYVRDRANKPVREKRVKLNSVNGLKPSRRPSTSLANVQQQSTRNTARSRTKPACSKSHNLSQSKLAVAAVSVRIRFTRFTRRKAAIKSLSDPTYFCHLVVSSPGQREKIVTV